MSHIIRKVRHGTRRGPSPALAVATLALVVALGGTGWAATRISGAQLNNRSVSHVKLKRHTITAKELNVGALGTVPRAAFSLNSALASKAADSSALGGFAAANYSENVWATQDSTPLFIDQKSGQLQLLKQPFVNTAPSSAGFLNFADVEASNSGGTPATLTMQMAVDGVVQPGSYSSTIDPGQSQSIFALLKCNGMPPGGHSIALLGKADGPLQLGTRADDGLRPIVIPPSGSTFSGEG